MIAIGQKRTEQRSWNTDYRGDLLICSTASPVEIETGEKLPFGVAVCIVTIKNVKKLKKGFSWQLSNPRPVIPFDVKGQQRLFQRDLSPDLLPPDIDHIEYFNTQYL
jgi:hypothetical protein